MDATDMNATDMDATDMNADALDTLLGVKNGQMFELQQQLLSLPRKQRKPIKKQIAELEIEIVGLHRQCMQLLTCFLTRAASSRLDLPVASLLLLLFLTAAA